MTAPPEWARCTKDCAGPFHLTCRACRDKAFAAAKAEGAREVREQPMDSEAEAEIGQKLEAEYQRGKREALEMAKAQIADLQQQVAMWKMQAYDHGYKP